MVCSTYSNNQPGGYAMTKEQQAEYDAKVEQIAATPLPKLVAGPFRYHLPVTVYQPTD